MKKTYKFFNYRQSSELLNEINTTPLVDVMLVLLIIFLITVPVVNSSINVSLPKEVNNPRDITKKNLVLTVSSNGNFYIGTKSFNLESSQVLEVYLNEISVLKPQPELHLKIDKDLLFEDLNKIMKLLQEHGIKKIAFLANPHME